MTINRSELEPLVQAWHASNDATAQPAVQKMIRAETRRIHKAFEHLPIQVQFVDFDPYGSFEEMRDQVQSTGTMLVWTGASDTPLWDPLTNWKARAVHDWDHIVKSCDFSMQGEAAAYRQAAQCRPGLAPLYLSEVMLQAAIKNYSGEFVEQKLVVLPEHLQRYAIQLRGPQPEEPTELPELVWTIAGVLRAGDAQGAMVHLAAMGYDPDTSLVMVDAARMLNAQVDQEVAAEADERRLGPRLGAAYPHTEETLVLADAAPPRRRAPRKRSRNQCASGAAEYAWMRVDPCMEVRPGVEVDPITNSHKLADFIRRSVPVENMNREAVLAIGVDSKNRPMGVHVAHIGGISSSIVDQTAVMQAMLLLGASAFFLAHNHPSGVPDPSDEDRALTNRMQRVGTDAGMPLLDHLVIGRDGFSSFRDMGLM